MSRIRGLHLLLLCVSFSLLFLCISPSQAEKAPVPKANHITSSHNSAAADEIETIIHALSQITVPKKAEKEIDKAIKELTKAIEEFRKNKTLKAFDKIKNAMRHLIHSQKSGAAVQESIDALITLVRGMVDIPLNKAIELAGTENKHIAKAQKHYTKALEYLAEGKQDKAIGEFKKVYKEAMKVWGEWLPDTLSEMLEERIIDIQELYTEDIPKKVLTHLEKAVDDLSKALNGGEKDNLEKALDKIKSAIKELEKAIKKGVDAQFIIELLVENVEDVVYLKIASAESVICAYNKEIIKAWKKFDDALAKLEKEDYDKAVDYFKEAVKIIEKIFTGKKGESIEFVEDETAPLITITSPIDGSFLASPSITIKGDVYEECSFARILVNGQSGVKGGEWPHYTFQAQIELDDGEHVIECIAVDGAGNEASAQIKVVVDTQPPEFFDLSLEDKFECHQREISVSGRIEDAYLVSPLIINDMEIPLSGNSFIAKLILEEGENSITFKAQDKAGNETVHIITVIYTPTEVDTTPPVISVLSPQEGEIVSEETVQIIGTVNDMSPFTLTITKEGQEFSVTRAGVNFSSWVNLSEGENIFVITAIEVRSEPLSSTSTLKVVRDSTPPNAPEFTYEPASPTNSDRVTFSGTGDPGSLITVVGGAENFSTKVSEDGNFELEVFLNFNASNTLILSCEDEASNKGVSKATVVVQDQVPPKIHVIAPATEGPFPVRNITIAGTIEESGSISVFTVNGNEVPINEEDEEHTFFSELALSDGSNSILLSVHDQAHNIAELTLILKVHVPDVDTQPPLITPIRPQEGAHLKEDTIQVCGSIIDQNKIDSLSISINGKAPLDFITGLAGDIFTGSVHLEADGENTLLIEAEDKEGYKAELTIALFHDTTAPPMPVVDEVPDITNAPFLSIKGDSEPGAMVRIEGGREMVKVRAGSSGKFGALVSLTQNSINNLSLIAIDLAGNESEPALVQVKQDSFKPQIVSISPMSGSIGVGLKSVPSITFNEAIEPDTISGNVTLLANGEFFSDQFILVEPTKLILQDAGIEEFLPDTRFDIVVETGISDLAGNELKSAIQSFFYTIDTTPPEPPVVSSDLPEATRYKHIVISGHTEALATVTCAGGVEEAETSVDTKGYFIMYVQLHDNTQNTLSLVARDAFENSSPETTIVIMHDNIPPGCTFTPSGGAINQPPLTYIDLLFTEPIQRGSLSSRFSLADAHTAFEGKLVFDVNNQWALFIPAKPLSSDTQYTIRIAQGLSDICGNTTTSDIISGFATLDTVSPSPPQPDNLPASTKEGSVVITGSSEAGSQVTIEGRESLIEAAADTEGRFSLEVALIANTLNHFQLKCKDASGNTSSPVLVSIRQDSAPPEVRGILPDGSRPVRYDTNVIITFSEPLLPDSLSGRIVLSDDQGISVPGSIFIIEGGSVVTFTPDHVLYQDKTYRVALTEGISDLLGNTTTTPLYFTFTTMVDPAYPKVPEIAEINPPSPTNESAVSIKGSTTPYCEVLITGGAESAGIQADETGSFALTAALKENTSNNLIITATNTVNQLSSSVNLAIIHDNQPPEVAIFAPPPGITLSKDVVTIVGTAKDMSSIKSIELHNGDKIGQIELNGSVFIGAVKLYMDEGSESTPNTITVKVTDSLSQTGEATLPITTISEPEGTDTTTPVITITSPTDGARVPENQVFVEGTVEDNDPYIMFSLTINGKAPDTLMFNIFGVLIPVENDPTSIVATATDSAGNTGSASIEVRPDLSEVSSPTIDPLPAHTDLLTLTVTGTCAAGLRVLLEGGAQNEETIVDDEGTFSLRITLSPNTTNYLKCYAATESGKKSAPAQATIVHDAEGPEVMAIHPEDGMVDVDPMSAITVTFSEAMNKASLNEESLIVSDSMGRIEGRIDFSPQGTLLTFTPLGELPRQGVISVRIYGSVEDLYGHQMGDDFLSSFTVLAKPTTITGIVTDDERSPLEGVSVSIEGSECKGKTDAHGLFSLNHVPAGEQHLVVDGSGALSSKQFTSLTFTLQVKAGEDNGLGRPLFLTPLDINSMVQVDPTTEQSLDFNGRIPGFGLQIKENSITFPNGKANGAITATEIDMNYLPGRLPDNSLPTMLVNLEPSGTKIDPACDITFPNKTNLPVGSTVTLFAFEGGMAEYQEIGVGIVTEDGRIVRSEKPCVNGFSFFGFFPIEEQGTELSTSDFSLEGRVIDVLGTGIPGVAVDVAASDTRSTTDDAGYYKIPLPERVVYKVKVFALIPTALSSTTGQMMYAVFESEEVDVQDRVTRVPDIVVNSIFLGGDIEYIDQDGMRVLPGSETQFHAGKLLSISDTTIHNTVIEAYKEQYPGIFYKEPLFTTTATMSPLDPYSHGRFIQQLFMGDDKQSSALIQPGDLIRIIAIDKATGYCGLLDTRIPALSGTSGGVDCEAGILLHAPRVEVKVSRVYYKDQQMCRQTVPHNGIALVSDQFIHITTCWSGQAGPLPDIPDATLYGRFMITTAEREQEVRFTIPPGEHTRIIDLRDIYPQRKLALDVKNDIGTQVLSISGDNNFSLDHCLFFNTQGTTESLQEYTMNIFDIKLITGTDDEQETASAEGTISPQGTLKITDRETGQVYTIEADENGTIDGTINVSGDQGYDVAVLSSQGVPTAPLTLGAMAYPVIASLSATEGTGGDVLTIMGDNFATDTTNLDEIIVRFNGERAEVISASEDTITVVVPENASAGPVTIKIAGLSSNDTITYDYISDGLPHGGFESATLRGFLREGQAHTMERFGKIGPTEGSHMAYLSTSRDPLNGVSTLTTDRFYVPEGMKSLHIDLNILATGFAGDLGSLLTAYLQVPDQEDRSFLPLASQTIAFIGGGLSQYEVNTLWYTISLDVSDLAVTEEMGESARVPVRLVIAVHGIAGGPFYNENLVTPDDDTTGGGDKIRGSGLLIDHIRLSENEPYTIPAPLKDKISVQATVAAETGLILGENGAVLADATAIATNLVTGDEYSTSANNEGGFSLEVGVGDGGKSHYVLQVKDAYGNRGAGIMVVVGE